jgi:tripartite-type tricarboxylate transporter receptor subunit TctC
MLTRRAAIAAALAMPALAQAQGGWPNGPIRIVAPFPPGGSVDATSRLIQPHLQQVLGVPVLVENKGGASGSIGTREVARAAPDGNTWVLVFDTHVVNPTLIPNMGFDTRRDLAPVLWIGTSPMMMTVHKARPWRSFAEMAAAAKARPDTISYGSIGNGSLAHLTVKLVEKAAGISLVHVPYRGGGPLATAAASGEVDLPTATGTIFVPHLQAGTILPLVTTGARRHPKAPEAPTLKELGLGVEAYAFWGVLAPAGTPAPIRERMEAALRQALAVPMVRERLVEGLGMDLNPRGPAEFAAFIDEQVETWGRVVRENGIKPD